MDHLEWAPKLPKLISFVPEDGADGVPRIIGVARIPVFVLMWTYLESL